MGRFDGRTEEPTPRARRRARREGHVARSQEVGVAAALLAAALGIRLCFPSAARSVASGMRDLLAAAPSAPSLSVAGRIVREMVLVGAVPFIAIGVVLALAGGLAQSGFVLAPGALRPKLSRLSPRQNLERLRPGVLGWEAARSVMKLGLLAILAWGPIREAIVDAGRAGSLGHAVSAFGEHAWAILARAAAFAVLVAVADYAFARVRTRRSQRMTRREVLEEHKETEGDPLVRMHRRRRHRELSRNRMLVEVASADVVVTNPTHLAVALRYRPGEPAPRVVAKGADRFARKIRAVAYRHGVFVREEAPLARALYRRCRVGQFIPPALYEAVALVLAIAYRRRRQGVM